MATTNGVIYKITCEPSGLSYIGRTIQSLSVRISQHKGKDSYCRLLSDAVHEYGWDDNFSVRVLWESHDYEKLGEMEKFFIKEHNTLTPNGYNLREGGGRSEKVCEESRQLFIAKQREISLRRNGLLGSVKANKSKVTGEITSWSLKGHKDGKSYTIKNCKTREEIIEIQKEFTKNPDGQLFEHKQMTNGKAVAVYYESDTKKWKVQLGKIYLGRYKTKEEAIDVLSKYKESPETYSSKKKERDTGVTFNKTYGKWMAAFLKNGKNLYLGRYSTKDDAISARKRFIEDPEAFVRPNQRKKIKL